MAQNISSSMLSEVYQRYYGFMLGFVAKLLRFDFAELRYSAHRARIEEVMSELDVAWRLPQRHADYRLDDRMEQNLALELKLVGKTMTDFYAAGHSALQVLIDPEDEAGQMATRTVWEVASEYELDQEVLADRIRPGWDRDLEGDDLIAELLSRAYDLTAVSLVQVPRQRRTCFVIMPFADPFRGYYRVFYRRSLNLAGYEAIRAWEGVTNEHYLQMIFMLLQKCGAALADLTAPENSDVPNLNVIHEVGLNMGAGNVSYLIRQPREVALPSNLTSLPYVTYDPCADDWPEGQAKELSRALGEIDEGSGRT